MKQKNVTITKLKKLNEKNVMYVTHLILKIFFLTLFGCGVKITPDIIYGLMDRPCTKDSKNS